jgi:hypothetical protein
MFVEKLAGDPDGQRFGKAYFDKSISVNDVSWVASDFQVVRQRWSVATYSAPDLVSDSRKHNQLVKAWLQFALR